VFYVINAYTRAAQGSQLSSEETHKLERIGGEILALVRGNPKKLTDKGPLVYSWSLVFWTQRFHPLGEAVQAFPGNPFLVCQAYR
jgi:hypothetical protein